MSNDENISDEPIFDATKRKKRSHKRTLGAELAETSTNTVSANTPVHNEANNGEAEDPLYTYEDLISRIPSIRGEQFRPPGKIRVPVLQVARIGTRRTSFVNFDVICKALQRQEKQLHDYFTAELGVTAAIDGNNSLVLRGRFTLIQIENVLRSFIRDYVVCKTCGGVNTLLGKSERLTVLKCNSCTSHYSVANIRSGFQAQIGRRSRNTAT
ncbi:hypothetical protein I4U23_025856 [Adineta vaga]|nr:hypothetical protein I4U23_025856 [Adineta vaga]